MLLKTHLRKFLVTKLSNKMTKLIPKSETRLTKKSVISFSKRAKHAVRSRDIYLKSICYVDLSTRFARSR